MNCTDLIILGGMGHDDVFPGRGIDEPLPDWWEHMEEYVWLGAVRADRYWSNYQNRVS